MEKIRKQDSIQDIKNILSIDLESWIHFYIDALKITDIEKAKLDLKKLDNNYIPIATENILKLLKKYHQKATFFVLAELYDWYPEIIETIESEGHEIGYHTYDHPLIKNKDILQEQLNKSGKFLDRFKPKGFRAPQIFITRESFAVLKENGFQYSSSTYDSFDVVEVDCIQEIPVSTIRLGKINPSDFYVFPRNLKLQMLFSKIPFGSGIFLSVLGKMISGFIKLLNKKNIPAVIFLHPWQIYQTPEIENIGFKLRVFLKNPLCFFYTKNRLKDFEILLQKHKFTSFAKQVEEIKNYE